MHRPVEARRVHDAQPAIADAQPAIADAAAHPERHDAQAERIAQLTDGIDRPEPDAEPADATNTDQRRLRQPRNVQRNTTCGATPKML